MKKKETFAWQGSMIPIVSPVVLGTHHVVDTITGSGGIVQGHVWQGPDYSVKFAYDWKWDSATGKPRTVQGGGQ